MNTTRFLKKALPACLAMVCAVPSCHVVKWDTGGVVKTGERVYKGFDTLHPVGGKVYVGADGKSYYMQAQEVSYTVSHRLVRTNGTPENKMGDPTPTGRTAWIQVKPSSHGECPPDITRKTGLREIPHHFSGWRFHKEEPALPAGAVLWNTGENFPEEPTVEGFGSVEQAGQSGPGAAAGVLSIPLTYVVDPILSTASSAVYAAVILGGGAVYVTLEIATLGRIGQSQIRDVPEPLLTEPDKEGYIHARRRGDSFVYSYTPPGKARGKDAGKWRYTYLPAPYLRKVIDTSAPLVLNEYCGYGMSEQDMEAHLRSALAPLQAQGIRIHHALLGNGKKWIRLEPDKKP